ncbi:predicted protein [Botrytis cinerea T4]|uniref:Uncharacterized protein n=1 Tax=Botryotinia fuckeliana (strain T4) TaxID=999810 RepID=G2XSK7_BOTF4|nr:predicted protein [Botrytis cinerea T4]
MMGPQPPTPTSLNSITQWKPSHNNISMKVICYQSSSNSRNHNRLPQFLTTLEILSQREDLGV